ncbi:MAG: DNA replication/repair protein RecF [Alphaproteobacteria bacterium]
MGTAPTGVTRLTIRDFRSYDHLRLDVDLRPVVLTGANGSGKTNLLEALSFLTPGRGLRRARLGEVTRRGAASDAVWTVAATVQGPRGSVDVGTGREPGGADRRVVRIDGRTVRGQVALAEVAAAVWLTPVMDRLFVEGAAGRRRFLDRLVFGLDPGHARRAGAYERAMRERGRLLREGRNDPAWLSALEATMAREGVAMAAARRSVVAGLCQRAAGTDGPFPGAVPTLLGAVEGWLDEVAEPEAETRLRRSLWRSRGLDAGTGGAAEGPHRSDLVIRHAAKGLAAEQCSTGEQKALLIALMLAQARMQAEERGAVPLLLLDEVVAHLDEARRRALFEEIGRLGAQAWLTGTDQALFAGFGDGAQFFRVEDSTLTRQPSI